ncbi:hypothetical protein RKE30_29225 [Streptomyces sp. Li-HN-5-11]|uniref:hypothetical protein n=1 Tax=Streptomyces sp. Li-HN-5-11 TaxID=3075432 RepID=UPI0028A77255|nr:hypothetical protein [Streptomyces sp. Li-HN-5-11]WNM34163.1 hypothetical protein RKE30_29225 [Streptomyces sp. Li-HN-5-11]
MILRQRGVAQLVRNRVAVPGDTRIGSDGTFQVGERPARIGGVQLLDQAVAKAVLR